MSTAVKSPAPKLAVVKQTKAPAPADTPAKTKGSDALAAARAARTGAEARDQFIYNGKIKEGAKKLAPQAQVIVNLVQASGKQGITRADLVAAMEGQVQTKQPLGRILGYYQKVLVEDGYLHLQKALIEEKPKASKVKAAPAEDETEETEESAE